MTEELDLRTGRPIEYCQCCGQRVKGGLVDSHDSWYGPDDPGVFEFRYAISSAMMRDAVVFERLIDLQLQRLRKNIIAERERLLEQKREAK